MKSDKQIPTCLKIKEKAQGFSLRFFSLWAGFAGTTILDGKIGRF